MPKDVTDIVFAPPPPKTLRDYFAGQALTGWLASWAGTETASEVPEWDICASHCYAIADAMLKAREAQ